VGTFKRAFGLLCILAMFFGMLQVHGLALAGEDYSHAQRRRTMIERDLKLRGIRDTKVLEAMNKVERHQFVGSSLEKYAYDDRPLPIGYGQTISQPYVVAFMSEALALDGEDRVLEIGTGSGYQAAILAEIVKEVYTIEILQALAEVAKKRLSDLGYENVHVKHGDGYKGWLEHAPYDKIIVTAAPDKVPEKLIEQLAIGGRMVLPLGSWYQTLYLITKTESGIIQDKLLPVRFVPMIKGDE